MRIAFILLLNFIIITSALAVDPDIILSDPAQEARAKKITTQLRCPTCISQSVDSSNVGVSKDLQILVREQIRQGRSDQEIYNFLTARYGDYILLKPRMNIQNALLWLLPGFIFIGMLFILLVRARKAKKKAYGTNAQAATIASALTPAEQEELDKILDAKVK